MSATPSVTAERGRAQALAQAQAQAQRDELEHAVRSVQSIVRDAQPHTLSGDEARVFADLFAEAERAASAGLALFTPVVDKSGSYAKVGHGSAVDWLAAISGSSPGMARGRLTAAQRASKNEGLTGALHSAQLSSAQLKLISDTEAAAPGSAATLLEMADRGVSHQEMSDNASRLRAAARSKENERERRDRVSKWRHFRWRQHPAGGVRGEFLCDEIEWAGLAPRLEALAKERWKSAHTGESLDAHRMDALLWLLAGGSIVPAVREPGSGSGSGSASRPHTIVIVDAEALRRGTAMGAELCEIEGIGPVSVDAVVELVGQGGMQLLVKDGVDVRTVTSTRRNLPQRVEAALLVRDRTCVVPQCGKRLGLEVDHCRTDFGDNGPTEMENLARLCPEHHDLKSYGGFRIEGGPGEWQWIAPEHPRSARYIALARRMAAAKGKAKRNDPRQT